MLRWNGASVETLLVVYRADSGAAFGGAPRGKMWVDSSGTVLRQEIVIFDSKLVFLRLPATSDPETDPADGEQSRASGLRLTHPTTIATPPRRD